MAASRMKLLQNQREAQMRSGPSRRWCCHSGRRGGSGRAPWRRATCCWISSRRTGWPGPGGFLSSGISIERAHEECRGIGVQDAGASPPLPSSGSGLETDVPFSGSCKRVFEVAVEFSRNIGYSFISLEHLAIALFTLFTLDDPTTNNLLGRWTPITGIRVGVLSMYKLRAFRRETLLWINLLNKVSTPLSISIMSNSSVFMGSKTHYIIALILRKWRIRMKKKRSRALVLPADLPFKFFSLGRQLPHKVFYILSCDREGRAINDEGFSLYIIAVSQPPTHVTTDVHRIYAQRFVAVHHWW